MNAKKAKKIRKAMKQQEQLGYRFITTPKPILENGELKFVRWTFTYYNADKENYKIGKLIYQKTGLLPK